MANTRAAPSLDKRSRQRMLARNFLCDTNFSLPAHTHTRTLLCTTWTLPEGSSPQKGRRERDIQRERWASFDAGSRWGPTPGSWRCSCVDSAPRVETIHCVADSAATLALGGFRCWGPVRPVLAVTSEARSKSDSSSGFNLAFPNPHQTSFFCGCDGNLFSLSLSLSSCGMF